MVIEEADIGDAEEILELQKTAYSSEARLYNDFNLPPLAQSLQEIRAEFDRQLFLKAVEAGEIVGSVRAYVEQGTCFIGRLIVRPDMQRRGIANKLMEEIERRFPDTERFELFTGHRSEGPLHLYRKRGYEPFKNEPVHENLTLVYLEKKPREGLG